MVTRHMAALRGAVGHAAEEALQCIGIESFTRVRWARPEGDAERLSLAPSESDEPTSLSDTGVRSQR
jgi:hypothetical protein